MSPVKSHHCLTFALSDVFILWNWWLQKWKRMKNRWCKFQKNGGLEIDEAKLEQLFIGPISKGVQGTVATLGFWEEIRKQMASGWISERQQSSLNRGSAQQGQREQGRLSPGRRERRVGGRAGGEGHGGKSKGRAGGLRLQTADKAQRSCAKGQGPRSVRGVVGPSLALLCSAPSPGFFFHIYKSKETIQMFSKDLFTSLCEKPSCFCGMMLRKIFSTFIHLSVFLSTLFTCFWQLFF